VSSTRRFPQWGSSFQIQVTGCMNRRTNCRRRPIYPIAHAPTDSTTSSAMTHMVESIELQSVMMHEQQDKRVVLQRSTLSKESTSQGLAHKEDTDDHDHMACRAESRHPSGADAPFLALRTLELGDQRHQACRRPPRRDLVKPFGAESVAAASDEFASHATSLWTSMVAPKSGNLTQVHKRSNAFANFFGWDKCLGGHFSMFRQYEVFLPLEHVEPRLVTRTCQGRICR